MDVSLCANCNQPRAGRYCTHCGQDGRDFRRTLPPLISELIREAFELDGRLLQSLKLLFFRPGALSLAFSANQRASFVSPVRLYLFASILFFFSISIDTEVNFAQINTTDVTVETDTAGTDTEPTLQTEALTSVLQPRHQNLLAALLTERNSIKLGIVQAITQDLSQLPGLPGPTRRFVYAQVIEALSAPGTAFSGMMDNLPVAMFVLLPAFALLLKLLFFGARRYYVEHLVYALHVHTFMFIVLAVLELLPEVPWLSWAGTITWLWVLLYQYLALRRYYSNGRFRTWLKYSVLTCLYLVLLVPALMLVLVISFVQL